MANVRKAIKDEPTTPGVEPDVITADGVREAEEAVLRRGLELRLTVALDHAGRMAGYTELRVGPEPDALATTEETAVLASHRGQGAATLVKAESLRLLQQDRPDVIRVVTENAETNAAMLAVNAHLGFRRVSRWRLGMLHIAG